jgi:fructose-specific phosphotransferase system IIA component
MMKLTDILSPGSVKMPLEATEKTDVIKELVDLLGAQGLVEDTPELLRCVLERERTRSTGIGHGLAVPHGKCAAVSKLLMAVGKPATPIDFDSKDGEPVSFVVLLASPPDQTGPHIQALARVSRLMLMESFRTALDSAASAADIYHIIEEFEK